MGALAAIRADRQCAPRVRRDPRPAGASTDRWRCAQAASARRGRENRPSCRAAAPRDRAPNRPHVMRNVSDGHADHKPAGVVRVGSRLGVYRVVVILGVGGIDGDRAGDRASPRARRARPAAPLLPPASAAAGNTFGIPWAWMAIRLTARSRLERAELFGDARARQTVAAPSRRSPRPPPGRRLARSRSAPGAIASSRPSCFFSIGSRRPPPPGWARKMPSTRCLRAIDELDDAPAVPDRVVLVGIVLDAQQSAVADAGTSPGRGRREIARGSWRRRRARPRPIRSEPRSAPRRASRAMTSASTTCGNVPG